MAFDPMMLTGPGAIKGIGNYLFPDPSKDASKTLGQIPGQIKPYYQPYMDAGNKSIDPYQHMMQMLMENPDEFMNKMGEGYKKSPGYDWNVKQGESAIANANAAGGMAGTPQHEQQNAEMTQGFATKDYGDYMNRVLQTLGIGAAGTGNIFNTGAGMSSDLAKRIAQMLTDKAELQYAGQANQNQQTGGLIGGAMGAATKFMGM